MVRVGAVKRCDRRHDRAGIAFERAADCGRNSVGGESPKALTADSTG
jgi:hypothetical protein